MDDRKEAAEELEALRVSEEDDGLPSVVKMKMSTFVRDAGGNREVIWRTINGLVAEMSKLVGQAYMFANFHISRLNGSPIPAIDRCYMYRCLLAVSRNNCNESTLGGEWCESVKQFDAFRIDGSVKVSAINRVQILADLSIMMATAGSNHLWTNLESRLTTYLQWKHPELSPSIRKSIVVALVKAPKAALPEIFKPVAMPKAFTSRAVERAKAELDAAKARKKAEDVERVAQTLEANETLERAMANAPTTLTKSEQAAMASAIRHAKRIVKAAGADLAAANQLRVQQATEKLALAKASAASRITAEVAARNLLVERGMQIAQELKAIMHLPSAGQFASRAHLTLPLYYKIQRETNEAKQAWAMLPEEADGKGKKKFRGKTFTLLPCKQGFTLSYIPVSSMMMFQILKDLKLINIVGDGRNEDKHAMWGRFFNLNAVETKTRRFGDRIATDGYAVSILMAKPACACCKIESDGGFSKCRDHVEKKEDGTLGWKPNVLIGAVDPGLTDVATTAYVGRKKETHSYSSSRYYQKALIHTSNRRTAKWNKDTEELVRDVPSCETALVEHIRHYLSIVDRLLAHRASKGYRAMRFLRYIKKKEAVKEVVDLIAPKENVVVLGFGDWKGPGKTPISRKTCGPIQDIKYALSRRANVIMEEIDEYGSSKHCSCCHSVLTNMRAERTTHKKKQDGTVKVSTQRGRVHKILHCRSSTNGLGGYCGASWDRDVNASRNLLVLTQCQIFGVQRPVAFCRKKITTRSPSGTNTDCETRQDNKNSVMGDLKHLFV